MASSDSRIADLTDDQVRAVLTLALDERSCPPDAAEKSADFLCELLGLDAAALPRILEHLERTADTNDRDPLSFECVAKIAAREMELPADKSFARLLTSSRTSRRALEGLARYGDGLAEGPFPDAQRRAGVIVRTLATAALAARFGVALPDAAAEPLRQVLRGIVQAAPFSAALRSGAAFYLQKLLLDAQAPDRAAEAEA